MAPAPKRLKLTNQQVGAAGEHYVAAEIHRRGGYAVTFSGNMRDIDLLASDADHDRVVKIQVKTKTSGTWQTSTTKGKKRREPQEESTFWVYVDLGKEHPGFYIVPEWWIQNDIDKVHRKCLKEHGGIRPNNVASTHHAIPVSRIDQWHNCWGELGILPKPPR